MVIGKNSVVSMHYEVATSEGEHVDRSEEGKPMTYLHGHGQIIPGLEAALAGHQAGETVEVLVQPQDAYGEHNQALDLRVSRQQFPEKVRPQLTPGFQFMAAHPEDGAQQVTYTVHRLEKDDVLVSGNHPLAGQTLQFKVRLMEVREATADELAHGHAHGPGGHHHGHDHGHDHGDDHGHGHDHGQAHHH